MKSDQIKVVEEARSIIDWLADGCKQWIGAGKPISESALAPQDISGRRS